MLSKKEPPTTFKLPERKSLLNLGFGNTVAAERVIAIVNPNSAPIKRLKEEAKEQKRLIDATSGRKTRSLVITDSNHVCLSAIHSETISQRYAALSGETESISQRFTPADEDEIPE